MKWKLVGVVVAMMATAAGCGGGGDGNPGDGGMTGDGGQTDDLGTSAVCGDEALDPSEPCDGELLDGATCQSLGFTGGTLRCLPDCRGVDISVCTVTPVAQDATPASALAIPDDGYDGTIASMACVDVVVPAGTRGYANPDGFGVELTMDHTFIGDLVVKLVAPSGHVSTLMHRPGLTSAADDGAGTGGSPANIASTHPIFLGRGTGGFMSESLGSSLTTAQAPCRDNIYCRYVANSPVGPNEISRDAVAGTWRVCVGDAASGDTGTITSVELQITSTTQPESMSVGGEVLQTAIADGAFDGTVASMTCRPFDYTALDESHTIFSIDTRFSVTHPNAGDLVFAIVDPAGELHALGVRPGVDEASDGSGAAAGSVANVAADPRIGILVGDPITYANIETLGEGIPTDGVACPLASSNCTFSSNGGALTWEPAEALLDTVASGTYQLCVGDAREGSAGTFNYVVLGLNLNP